MSSKYPPDEPRRIVRPRSPRFVPRYLIALDNRCVYLERTRATLPRAELPRVLAAEPSAILIGQDVWYSVLRQMLDTFGKHPTLFQYRLTPRNKTTWTDGVVSRPIPSDAMVNLLGWKATPDTKAKFHYPLDPVLFCRAGIDDLYPDLDRSRIERLFLWGKDVREWCQANRLVVKPSAGGLAAQLLRNPSFYPEARRKVPKLINSIARTQLPGNYYHLRAKRDRLYRAIYLDMADAHHAMAKRIRFPDANSLHAYGYWGAETRRKFADGNSELLARPGIFDVTIRTALVPSHLFPPPYLQRDSTYRCWLYSNELSELTEFSAKIETVHAALVSDKPEPRGTGLNAYAEFAIQQLRKERAYRPWLKPTLHATYGMLAARPVEFETGLYQSSSLTTGEYHIGPESFPVYIHSANGTPEPRIANVIHRGMIEAEVRKEALHLARMLSQADGEDILCIYADSLIIRDRGNNPDENGVSQLKLLPGPWRIKAHLTNLRFFDSTHFVSDELTRMPGLPKNAPERARRDAIAWADARALVARARPPKTPLAGPPAELVCDRFKIRPNRV